jgi:hypothetical protein
MIDDILEEMKGKDDNALKRWMLRSASKLKLKKVWDSMFPGRTFKPGEMLWLLSRPSESAICKNGNHKTFKQFPKGYFNSCDNPDGCKCHHDTRSANTKAYYDRITDEEKKANKDKAESTNLERYGVKNPFQSEKIKADIKKSNLEKYGVEYSSQRPDHAEKMRDTWDSKTDIELQEIIEKRQETCEEKYGYANIVASPMVREKSENTMMERYGVKNYFDSSEHQDAIRQQRYEEFGVYNAKQLHIPLSSLDIIHNPEKFSEFVKNKSMALVAKELEVSETLIAYKVHEYDLRSIMNIGAGSSDQILLSEFIRTLGFEIQTNIRKIITPKELDIYIPSRNIAVEYNGDYYHSESNGKHEFYHYEKYKKCKNLGIMLIQVSESDYEQDPKRIKDSIEGALCNYYSKPIISNLSLRDEWGRLEIVGDDIKNLIVHGKISLQHIEYLISNIKSCTIRIDNNFPWDLSKVAEIVDEETPSSREFQDTIIWDAGYTLWKTFGI